MILSCRLLVLALSVMSLAGCQNLNSKSAEALRCPAEAANVKCHKFLTPDVAVLTRETFRSLPVSPFTERVYNNLTKLDVRIRLQNVKDPTAREKQLSIELTFTQFLDAYRSFPGGNELIAILQNPEFENGAQIKQALNAWLNVYLPGYNLYWEDLTKPSFIEEAHFFNYLSQKIIPIGNHHDILAHLFLFLDPKIRNLTERLANIYDAALKRKTSGYFSFQHIKLAKHVNFLWARLQEDTPVQYKDAQGINRLAIIGGYPSLIAPFEYVTSGSIYYWIYMREMHIYHEQLAHYLKSNLTLRHRGELLELQEKVLHEIGEMIGIKKRKDILLGMRYAPEDLSNIFLQLNFETKSYDEHWQKFSDMILKQDSPAISQVLKPENHRKIIEHSLEVLELLLKENP